MIRKILSLKTKTIGDFNVGDNGVESIYYQLTGLQGLNSLSNTGSYKVIYAEKEDMPGIDTFELVPYDEMASVGYIEFEEKEKDECEVPNKEPEAAE